MNLGFDDKSVQYRGYMFKMYTTIEEAKDVYLAAPFRFEDSLEIVEIIVQKED